MASTPPSGTGLINIKVEISAMRANSTVELKEISSSMTIGEIKKKLNVQPNSRFGRANEFENWDNRRPLSDYFVENGESFQCVTQCVVEDGQSSFDDYNEWLSARNK